MSGLSGDRSSCTPIWGYAVTCIPPETPPSLTGKMSPITGICQMLNDESAQIKKP